MGVSALVAPRRGAGKDLGRSHPRTRTLPAGRWPSQVPRSTFPTAELGRVECLSRDWLGGAQN